MTKLTKSQRSILIASLEVAENGKNQRKPITFSPRRDWTGYVKAQGVYFTQMHKLCDAGVIVADEDKSFAYVEDIAKVKKVLADNAY